MGQDNQDDQDNQEDSRGKSRWRDDRLKEKLERMHELQRIQFGQRGFLRPQIVELFERGPMNGVDIMNRLQEMSHGWYRPSPGSIYPLLEQLEREGLIAKNKEGKFELTQAFARQSGVGDDLATALSALESNASYLEDLHRADAARVAKCSERIDKLAKRLGSLSGELQSGSGQR
jgi:hypothetical protein